MSKDRLRAGESLLQGQSITSANGKFRLSNKPQAPFTIEILEEPVQSLWTITSRDSDIKLSVQDDGNVVLYHDGKPGWSTKTDHKGDASTVLIIQDDGDVVVKSKDQQIWNSKTKIRNRLQVGDIFDRGLITSPNGKVRFWIQNRSGRYQDLFLKEGDKTLWKDDASIAIKLTVRSDDNFIGLTGQDNVYWQTRTGCPKPDGKAVFQVLDEGVALLKARGKVIWSTNHDLYPVAIIDAEERTNRITWGECLNVGASITSPNKEFSAVFREDGVWAVIHDPTKNVLWSMKMADFGVLRLCMDYYNFFFSFDQSGKVMERKVDVNTKELHFGERSYPDGCGIKLHDDGALVSEEGGNAGWDELKYTHPWGNRLWLPLSKDSNTKELRPGQCLAVGQSLNIARRADGAMGTYSLNEAGDFILSMDGKTTYFRTGPHKSRVQLLKFTRNEILLIGAGNEVIWKKPYSEPFDFRLREVDLDPPKLQVDFYGELVVRYKERNLWGVFELQKSTEASGLA